MKNIAQIIKQAEQFAANNSPSILTGVGVVGTIGTAVLTGKAAVRADGILRGEDRGRAFGDELARTPKETVKLVWKQYIPPVVFGTVTVVSIVGANRIGGRRTAAITAAYAIADKGYTEYREKVIETLGEKKERSLRDSVAQDRINNNPPNSSVIVSGNSNVLFYDAYTDRYFSSTVENIKKAQNDTNHQVITEGYASLNDFYLRAGLGQTSVGEEVGWTADKLLEVEFSTCLSEEANQAAISIDFRVRPVRDFHKMN